MKLFGKITLKISVWWAVSLAILFFLNGKEVFFIMMISAICHEAGHLLAMAMLRVFPEEITFGFLNFNIKYNKNITTYKTDILISLCGVLVNFMLCIVSLVVDNYDLLIVNTSLAVVNLLPLDGLDGGNILSALKRIRENIDPYENMFDKVYSRGMRNALAVTCFVLFSVASDFNLSVVFSGASFIACGEIYKI